MSEELIKYRNWVQKQRRRHSPASQWRYWKWRQRYRCRQEAAWRHWRKLEVPKRSSSRRWSLYGDVENLQEWQIAEVFLRQSPKASVKPLSLSLSLCFLLSRRWCEVFVEWCPLPQFYKINLFFLLWLLLSPSLHPILLAKGLNFHNFKRYSKPKKNQIKYTYCYTP